MKISDLSEIPDSLFRSISNYVASHESFNALSSSEKLVFYGLFKASFAQAPRKSLIERLYEFSFKRTEYEKWAAWEIQSSKYEEQSARRRYCELSMLLDCFPSSRELDVMVNGSGTSKPVVEERLGSSAFDSFIDLCQEDDIAALDVINEVNTANEEGTTYLHFAVDFNATKLVRALLLVPELNINATDDQGQTALHVAAIDGHHEIASLLLENGINPDIIDCEGQSAMDIISRDEALS